MNRISRISIVAGIAVAITLSHYIIDPHAGSVHDILQRVYYIPIVLAGLWFGVRGGLITAFLITLAYLPHARHGWYGPYTFVFQGSEMLMYHLIGALCGYLSSRERRAFEAEKEAHREKEQAYAAERVSRLEKEEAFGVLQEKTKELFAMEEELRRSDRLAALGRLSAGLAHEIRNPLGSIKTSAEMLSDCGCQSCPEPGTDQPDFVEIIQQEVDRLDRTLSEFLRFAKESTIEPGLDDEEEKYAGVADTLSRTVELLRPDLEKRQINVEFETHVMAGDVFAKISPSHLQQVLLNLILNAIEAIDRDGSIHFSIESSDEKLELSIHDSGDGIPEDFATKIFDPFVSSKKSGSGLGLSITDRILTANGGSISLDTDYRPRNKFIVILPITYARLTN